MWSEEINKNRESRQRMRHLVNSLSEDELGFEDEEGWSISVILAHLAFWDYRVLYLLRRWEDGGIGDSPIDVNAVNDALLPILRAISPLKSAALAYQAAEAVDDKIETLPDDLKRGIDKLVQEGKFRSNRSLHRNEHLDQIQKILLKRQYNKTG